jgi:hypothetical protein
MKRILALFLVFAIGAIALASDAVAGTPGVGQLYYEGSIVRTVVPPAQSPQAGRDDFFGVTNGVSGQLGVVAVAPGAAGYHGGQWAFHSVTFNVAPYLLTSAGAVHTAAGAGDVTITRVSENDFKCPIQP